MIDNFIYVNDNSMTSQQCQQLIDLYEDNPEYHLKGSIIEVEGKECDLDKAKKCMEMFFKSEDLENRDVLEPLSSALKKTIVQYVLRYPFLKQLTEWSMSHTFKIQKYLPGEAYFSLHTENTGHRDGVTDRRLIAWMVYLNDVTDGGETEFPTQEVKVKPKQGSMLFWPAYWTHPHRGLPSPTQVKYILTGWFSFI